MIRQTLVKKEAHLKKMLKDVEFEIHRARLKLTNLLNRESNYKEQLLMIEHKIDKDKLVNRDLNLKWTNPIELKIKNIESEISELKSIKAKLKNDVKNKDL